MADLQEFARLKKRVEDVQREADKALGALDQTMKQLKKEFGCDSIEDAEKRLKELNQDAQQAKKRFEKCFSAFERRWSSVLKATKRETEDENVPRVR